MKMIHATHLTPAPGRISNLKLKWLVKPMNHSIGIENSVLTRDARPAASAAAGAAGSASPSAATCSADPMAIFCAGQMTSQTLRNIVVPSSAPQAMLMPWVRAK